MKILNSVKSKRLVKFIQKVNLQITICIIIEYFIFTIKSISLECVAQLFNRATDMIDKIDQINVPLFLFLA